MLVAKRYQRFPGQSEIPEEGWVVDVSKLWKRAHLNIFIYLIKFICYESGSDFCLEGSILYCEVRKFRIRVRNN